MLRSACNVTARSTKDGIVTASLEYADSREAMIAELRRQRLALIIAIVVILSVYC